VSGSGKTTLARALAERLSAPLIELDALMHQPDGQPRPDAEFKGEVEKATLEPAWVADGNYRQVVIEGPVWERADTVVWLDLPRLTMMRRLIARTVSRAVRREVLWNGNREPLTNFVSLDPERSIFVWSWITYDALSLRYSTAMTDSAWRHLTFVRLRSDAEVRRWLDSIPN
jgi:adenylate kinase family enzyme